MKKAQVAKLKQELLAKKAKLVARLAELGVEDPFADADRVNDNASVGDDAAEESGHERIEVLQRTTREEIEAIEAAVARIEQGIYGQCEKCGGEISDERLAAVPVSTVCVACSN